MTQIFEIPCGIIGEPLKSSYENKFSTRILPIALRKQNQGFVFLKFASFHKNTDDAGVQTTWSSVHFRGLVTHKRLISQSFSAFCASSLKNVSAVSSSHSLSKAVLFFSLSFFRLICSEHYCHLLGICSEACCFSAFSTLLHNDIIYYKHKMPILSSLFSIFLQFFFYIYAKNKQKTDFNGENGSKCVLN